MPEIRNWKWKEPSGKQHRPEIIRNRIQTAAT
jgi:hypothetical protein